jgi:transglutaminase-like putative cysteine protease
VIRRYVTGYIEDIRQSYSGPGDFSAWYQVFLEGRWIDLDARHNYPRLGRILMATGRDAAAVAITTSFGTANLATVAPWGAFLATCSWFNRAIYLSSCSGISYEAFHLLFSTVARKPCLAKISS